MRRKRNEVEKNITIEAAHAAGAMLLRVFNRRGTHARQYKRDREIVLAADLRSNRLITLKLLEAFPNDDVVSEEAPKIDNPGRRTWYVDPLDGTTNFAYGFTNFAVCIGLHDGRDMALGVVHQPMHRETYVAVRKGGAWLHGPLRGASVTQRLHVSTRASLDDAMLLICSGYSKTGRDAYLKFLKKIINHHARIRQFASAGVELAALAAGRADVVYITDVKPWDAAAGVLLVREAGGIVTDRLGRPWEPDTNHLVASNGRLHRQILKLL